MNDAQYAFNKKPDYRSLARKPMVIEKSDHNEMNEAPPTSEIRMQLSEQDEPVNKVRFCSLTKSEYTLRFSNRVLSASYRRMRSSMAANMASNISRVII
jgi:hypothetical protein